MKKSRQGVTERYLTVVPAISNTLEGPAYGSDDTEDTCGPVTAAKNADCLDYSRGSGTEMGCVDILVRI